MFFTSIETVGLLGMGPQDSHCDFHTAPELSYYYYYWSLFHCTTLCSLADSLDSCHMWFWPSVSIFLYQLFCCCILCGCVKMNKHLFEPFCVWISFCTTFFNVHWSGVLTALCGCYMAGATWNCCCFSAHSVFTIQPCISLQHHFIQRHIHGVHVCV